MHKSTNTKTTTINFHSRTIITKCYKSKITAAQFWKNNNNHESTAYNLPLFLCCVGRPTSQNEHGMVSIWSFHLAVQQQPHRWLLLKWLHWFHCRSLGSCWSPCQCSSCRTSQQSLCEYPLFEITLLPYLKKPNLLAF